MNFKDILGHDRAKESLTEAIEGKKLSHSYLFEGEEGIGKKLLAYAFSKALLCEEANPLACGSCQACIKFDNGNHPDFYPIEAEKAVITIDQIRDLTREMITAPLEGKKKVFLINDSHKMNVESQNALLKTLEEPADFALIILISHESSKLLPTVLSRSQLLKFHPLSRGTIADYLIGELELDKDQANLIASLSQGAIGRALDMLKDDRFLKDREELLAIIDDIIAGDRSKVFSSREFFAERKDRIDELLDLAIYWFRDLLIYKEIGQSELLTNLDKIELLKRQIHLDINEINDIIDNIIMAKANIRRNVNFQLLIETMLLKI